MRQLDIHRACRHHGTVLFPKTLVPGIVAGDVTLTFRGWAKSQARVGGRHRVWGMLLEVDDVRLVDASGVTDHEARMAGEPSAAELLRRLRPSPERPIWRIQFRYLGPDDRLERREDADLDEARRAALRARLDRLDRASKSGPWTAKTLRLIASYPGVVSTALARHVPMERPAFKINVRKLKELGLTESLEIGYRLSPLGRAFTGTEQTAAAHTAAAAPGAGSDDDLAVDTPPERQIASRCDGG
jgi:hypothetical protein